MGKTTTTHKSGGGGQEFWVLPDSSLANASRGPATKHTTGEDLTNQFNSTVKKTSSVTECGQRAHIDTQRQTYTH